MTRNYNYSFQIRERWKDGRSRQAELWTTSVKGQCSRWEPSIIKWLHPSSDWKSKWMKNLEWSSRRVFLYLGGGKGARNTCGVWRHPEKLMKKQCDWLSEEGFKEHRISLFSVVLFSTNTKSRYPWVIWRLQDRNLPLPGPFLLSFEALESGQLGRTLGRTCCCSYCNYMDSSPSDGTCSWLMSNHSQKCGVEGNTVLPS